MAEAPVVTLIRDLTFGASPWKPAVRALADSNVTRSGPQTIDGVAVVRDELVLLTAQTNATENGPWTVKDAAWTRPAWFDQDSEVFAGATVYISEGTTYQKQFWTLTTTGSGGRIRLGFDNLTWDQRILGGGAPPDDPYWVDGTPDAALTNAINTRAVTTTLEVASTTTIPLARKRTDAATAALVDVEKTTVISGGTPLANFGGSHVWQAKNGAGSTVDLGRWGFRWSNPAAASETSQWVLQLRSAGAALATALAVDGNGNVTTAGTVYAAALDRAGAELAIGPTATGTTITGPVTLTRAASADNAVLDVAAIYATYSGTSAVGFGPGLPFYAKQAAGGTEQIGRLAFVWTDLTGTSEDSKAVLYARTAGAALAACAELSGTAAKLTALAGVGTRFVTVAADGTLGATSSGGADATAAYLTNAAAAVNANDVPIQDLAAQLTFKLDAGAPIRAVHHAATAGTDVEGLRVAQTIEAGGGVASGSESVSIALALPNGAGAQTVAGTWRAEWTTVPGGGTSKLVWAPTVAGTSTDRMTLTSAGALSVSSSVTAGSAGFISDGGLDASTATALPIGSTTATAVNVGGAAIPTNVLGNLAVTGDLTVSGTTTTVDSTTVSLADRLVVFNSSALAVVPVPVDIAGFVVDRGSADGVTKRDAPGMLWDEANSRFDVAYNTALDQSTIGALVPVRLKALTVSDFSTGVIHADASGVLSSSLIVNADVDAAAAIAGTKISPNFGSQNVTTTGGFTGASFDREAAGALPIGAANATSVTITPDTTVSGILTKTGTGLTTTVVAGIRAQNSTAATGGATVQNGYAVVSEGAAWETSGGTSKILKGGFLVQPVSGGSVGLRLRLCTDPGTGTLGAITTEYTTSLPGIGGPGWQSPTFNALADSGNGYRLITSSGTEYGNLKVSSNSVIVTAQRNQADARVELQSNITTGSTDDGVRIWNYAGTRTAGNLAAFGDGGSWTEKAAVEYDGLYDGPRLRKTALKTGAYTAAAWDLVLCDPTGGGFTVTVPTGTVALTGRRIGIKNYGTSTNAITIEAATGSIQGGTLSIAVAWGYYELECVGTDGWIVVSEVA